MILEILIVLGEILAKLVKCVLLTTLLFFLFVLLMRIGIWMCWWPNYYGACGIFPTTSLF